MTAQPVHQYTARPVGDGSGEWILIDRASGQELFRASERLVKAKMHLNVDYEAQRPAASRSRRRKRER
jgi:hypothetical protein